MDRSASDTTTRSEKRVGPPAFLRILVVEPDDDTRSLYRDMLVLGGFDVVEAVDGRDALTKALIHAPSLVSTELRLPVMDGFALCEILRRDRTTARVPILIVTTEPRLAELHRARQAADAVLQKPTTPERLLSEIQRLTATTDGRQASRTSVGAEAAEPDARRRKPLAKAHSRTMTIEPPAPPPTLTCPRCDGQLAYVVSHVGGVSERHSEQWDYFACFTCGGFQFRQRTRKLRPLRHDETEWVNTMMKGH